MGPDERRDLYVYNGGLLTGRRVRRILALSGWDVRLGLPGPGDWVGVWGRSPTAPRGEAVARHREAPVLRVEDAFLRSVLPGRSGEPTLGLCLDQRGVHFDAAGPSDLEHLLAREPLDDTALLDAARAGAERMAHWQISKYNDFDQAAAIPEAPYVLVIDQTRGDAAVVASGADVAAFREMLVEARVNHPGTRVIIKAHPETAAGHRRGHFGPEDETETVQIFSAPVSPYALMQGAVAVYTISSQIGFEAIYAGHRPRVFGQPFYAGWGLTEDAAPMPRRGRSLTRAQLFAAAMLLYPKWYDPYRDALCSLDQVIDTLTTRARAQSEDRRGYVAANVRAWKRPHMRAFFGGGGGLGFANSLPSANARAAATGRRTMVWGAVNGAGPVRVEDGFLRSRGLGAKLVPPLSLVTDDLGIYYDPSHPSRLEQIIAASTTLPKAERARARNLIRRIVDLGLTKYNLAAPAVGELPDGRRILVPGQVEDDASIVLGCDAVNTNLALLERARDANPDATLLYKPHPDVVAGLRKGAVADADAARYANLIVGPADPAALIDMVDEVWTMTSTIGFEALLRGKPVTCLGTPFYAGWGLTRDLGPQVRRRAARPDIVALAHACLIGYPRYFDPLTGTACPVEVAIDRMVDPNLPQRPVNRILAALQSALPMRHRG